MYPCCDREGHGTRGNDLVHPRQLAASKAASSAKLTACWMVVTVGVWLGTELNPFEAR